MLLVALWVMWNTVGWEKSGCLGPCIFAFAVVPFQGLIEKYTAGIVL